MKNTPISLAILSMGMGIMGAILYTGRQSLSGDMGQLFIIVCVLLMIAALISAIKSDKKQ